MPPLKDEVAEYRQDLEAAEAKLLRLREEVWPAFTNALRDVIVTWARLWRDRAYLSVRAGVLNREIDLPEPSLPSAADLRREFGSKLSQAATQAGRPIRALQDEHRLTRCVDVLDEGGQVDRIGVLRSEIEGLHDADLRERLSGCVRLVEAEGASR